MKRLLRQADARNLPSNLQLDANTVLDQIKAYNPKFNSDNLVNSSDVSAFAGYVDDSGHYVLEIYGFKDLQSVIVVSEIVNGTPSYNLDMQFINGSRTDARNSVVSNGYTLSNGTKLTFSNQYTDIPLADENNNIEE